MNSGWSGQVRSGQVGQVTAGEIRWSWLDVVLALIVSVHGDDETFLASNFEGRRERSRNEVVEHCDIKEAERIDLTGIWWLGLGWGWIERLAAGRT